MTYVFTCFSEGCVDFSYAGTMVILAAYKSADNPRRAGYRHGLSVRTGIDVQGAAFDIMTADLERDAVTADPFAEQREDGAYVRTDGLRKRDLKAVFTELMKRSPAGRLFVVFQYNGMASRESGPPVPHANLGFSEFLDRIEKDELIEGLLYVVQGA